LEVNIAKALGSVQRGVGGKRGSSSVSWSGFARSGRNPKAEELEKLPPKQTEKRGGWWFEVDKYRISVGISPAPFHSDKSYLLKLPLDSHG